MNLDSNPYRSPEIVDEVESNNFPRTTALFRFRIAVALLIMAAFVNAFFLPRYVYSGTAVILDKYRIGLIDFIFLTAVAFFAMTCTFEILERLAKLLHRTLAPRSDLQAWNNAIYNAFRPAIPLGLAGALLWIIWVIAFFELKVNFYVISYAVGIPAHLLGAAVYLRILWGWFKAAKSTPSFKATTPLKPKRSDTIFPH